MDAHAAFGGLRERGVSNNFAQLNEMFAIRQVDCDIFNFATFLAQLAIYPSRKGLTVRRGRGKGRDEDGMGEEEE